MSGRGDILPFRVSTDFNLGLFLKNEKSALKLNSNKTDTSSEGGGGGTSFSPAGGQIRFKQVDDYVTHEYWSLDIEFLLSCLVPILWSITGIYLLGILEPVPCIKLNRDLIQVSVILFIFNIATEFVIILGLVFAKYCNNWHIKIILLNSAIGIKLLLNATNFIVAVVNCSTHSCGTRYSNELHEYDNENHVGTASSKPTTASIIDGFRYYDTKVTGLSQIFASVGQCVGAMILLVKRNDIKMYALWRLAKLDEYIDEMHSHM